MNILLTKKSKAVFSEENYVPFGQTLKLQSAVVTVNIGKGH